MKTTRLIPILLTLSLVCFTNSASAKWVLNNSESTLNFISIKKSKVGEIHHFKKFEGALNDDGKVSIEVKLNSVETNIPIRNDRMQQFLFEVVEFPIAKVATKIAINDIHKLKVGESFSKKIPFEVSIHGQNQKMSAAMRVTLLAGNKLLVSTINPIILNLGNYALIEGIEKLKELAKLPSISTAVPVTAHFIFEK